MFKHLGKEIPEEADVRSEVRNRETGGRENSPIRDADTLTEFILSSNITRTHWNWTVKINKLHSALWWSNYAIKKLDVLRKYGQFLPPADATPWDIFSYAWQLRGADRGVCLMQRWCVSSAVHYIALLTVIILCCLLQSIQAAGEGLSSKLS